MVDEMIDILRSKMESDYKAGSTLRDAHPKALGVMKGTLTVADDVPPDLRIGIFAQAGASFGCQG